MKTTPEDEGQFIARSLKYLQETLRAAGPAVAAGYTLIAAILIFGGIGYAVDAWRETSPWFLLAGLLLGLIVGFFELAKILWRK